jgi:hypothetical protein
MVRDAINWCRPEDCNSHQRRIGAETDRLVTKLDLLIRRASWNGDVPYCRTSRHIARVRRHVHFVRAGYGASAHASVEDWHERQSYAYR